MKHRDYIMKLYMVNKGVLQEQSKLIFSTGDSYIIDDDQKIWIWLGKNCSVDEKGTAAVEARRLDDERGGAAKIITVDQGNELVEFLSLVDGIRIVDKNLAKTMLKDVSTGSFAGHESHQNALYRVSSEEFENISTMKFVQVPFERSSLDSEDAFIADLGDFIWVWVGRTSNAKEKVKAGQAARKFDAERSGAQDVEIFEEGDDSEFLGIFEGKLPVKKPVGVDLKAEVADITPTEDSEFINLTEPSEPEPKIEPKSEPAPEPTPVVKLKPIPGSEKVEKPVPEPTPEVKEEKIAPIAEDGTMIQRSGSRLKCPKCDNIKSYMIREIEDRTRVINDYPIIYGKKFVCGVCGTEWRRIS